MSGKHLTERQKDWVLLVIAQRSLTLSRLLMLLEDGRQSEFEGGTLLAAAQFMADAVGAMADDASGGEAFGSMTDWLYGPTFNTLAKQEVAA